MSMPIYWEIHTKSGEEKNTPNRPNPLWILTQQSALETPHKHYGGFFFQYFLSLLINFYMLKFIRIVYVFLDIRTQFISGKSIPYRIDRYGQYILYRQANRYIWIPCFLPKKIPAVSVSYRPYRQNPVVSAS